MCAHLKTTLRTDLGSTKRSALQSMPILTLKHTGFTHSHLLSTQRLHSHIHPVGKTGSVVPARDALFPQYQLAVCQQGIDVLFPSKEGATGSGAVKAQGLSNHHSVCAAVGLCPMSSLLPFLAELRLFHNALAQLQFCYWPCQWSFSDVDFLLRSDRMNTGPIAWLTGCCSSQHRICNKQEQQS